MEYKTKLVDGHEACFCSDWIADLEQELHFNWCYQQADLAYSNCRRDQRILEIGIGTGLLSDLLRKRGWNIKTLDIDENKSPDFCSSASEFDFIHHNIEIVLAFEIFEHIPFSTFEKVVDKLADSDLKAIYFSLPWNERQLIDFRLKLPRLEPLVWSLSFPTGEIVTRAHFWELSKKPDHLAQSNWSTLLA